MAATKTQTSTDPFKRCAVALCAALFFLVVGLSAQPRGNSLTGRITSGTGTEFDDLMLEVRGADGGGAPVRSPVSADGSFEIENGDWSASGWLEIRIFDGADNEVHRELRQSTPLAIDIRLERRTTHRTELGTVSLEQLRRPGKSFRKAMRRSQRALRKNNLPESAEYLSQAAAFEPTQTAAYLGLGTVLLELRQYGRAFGVFGAALEINPESEGAQSGRAIALHGLGRLTEAEQQARLALQHHPDSARCHYVLGSILVAAGDRDETALVHLETASAQHPRALLTAARVHMSRGRQALAEDALRRCFVLAKSKSEVHAECSADL